MVPAVKSSISGYAALVSLGRPDGDLAKGWYLGTRGAAKSWYLRKGWLRRVCWVDAAARARPDRRTPPVLKIAFAGCPFPS